jgi:hypothetical protein
MKKQILSLAAALSLGASAFAAVPTDTWNSGELLLSFATTASTTNLVVNLGSFSQFATFDGATTNLTRLNVADLANTFGSWNSDANLKYAIIGATATSGTTAATGGVLSAGTIFTVSPRFNINSTPTAITAQTISTQNGDITDISAAGNNGYNNADTAGFSNTFTVGILKDNVNSFFARQNTTPTVRFGTAQDQTAVGTTIVDLYGLTPASGLGSTNATATGWNSRGATLLGSFELSSSGLSYTAVGVAIPEPSTYAALGGLVALGFAASRRRRVQA